MKNNAGIFSAKLLFLILLAFTGCSWYQMSIIDRENNLRTYDGPVLSKNEVGFLCKTPEVHALEILELDGRKIQEIKETTGSTGRPDVLELLPGKHSIKIIGGTDNGRTLAYRWSYSIGGEWKMEFFVEPGHVYLLNLKTGVKERGPEGKNIYSSRKASTLFTIDARTKKIVSEIIE
jgi:hypothetical protein